MQGLLGFKARTVIDSQRTTRDFIRGEIRRQTIAWSLSRSKLPGPPMTSLTSGISPAK
jgi:hypothetical protein